MPLRRAWMTLTSASSKKSANGEYGKGKKDLDNLAEPHQRRGR